MSLAVNHTFQRLLTEIRQCKICDSTLPLGANPVVQITPQAKILIAGQAPGIKVHESSIPFNDKSGERLRQWLGIPSDTFYNENKVAILPMAFCYPGKGKSGDLPPRVECANTWRKQVMAQLPNVELIIAIGQYAQKWHLKGNEKKTLTETVQNWKSYQNTFTPPIIPIPHPSPRNNIWLAKNSWFESDVIPYLQNIVEKVI